MPDASHANLANLSVWTDEALWEAFKKGNSQAFSDIYRQYSAQLYNYGRQITRSPDQVKDAIQDMFVSLWQNRETLGTTHTIRFYLFTCLRRRIIEGEEKYKKVALRQYRYQEEGEPAVVFPFDDQLVREEYAGLQKKKLQEAIGSLSPRQKEVIFLLYYQNMRYEAVATLMGITTRSVYTLAWKATEALRKKIHPFSPSFFEVPLLLTLLSIL